MVSLYTSVWHESVADRRRVASLGEKIVSNPLNVAMLNVRDARSTGARDDVVAQGRRAALGL
jgi:hypothetical protein